MAATFCLSGELHGIFRAKSGRHRIFYIACAERRRAIVLFVGWRKEGSPDDAYEELKRYLRRPDVDRFFEELGQRKPVV